jgi:VWFA-related protein
MAAQFPERPSADGTRRVQVVLSDGQENNSSRAGLTEAFEALQHADCVFYAINPIGANTNLNRISLEGQRVLQALAAQTGGMAFIPQATEELPVIFDRIVAELQAQYLLEYYSTIAQADGSFRRIRVSIPGRPDLRIRARQGYYSRRS